MKSSTPTKAELLQEIASLKRRNAVLERDRMFARSLLKPNQEAVYKAALECLNKEGWIFNGECIVYKPYSVGRLEKAIAKADRTKGAKR